jgi:hypothetical protein
LQQFFYKVAHKLSIPLATLQTLTCNIWEPQFLNS